MKVFITEDGLYIQYPHGMETLRFYNSNKVFYRYWSDIRDLYSEFYFRKTKYLVKEISDNEVEIEVKKFKLRCLL